MEKAKVIFRGPPLEPEISGGDSHLGFLYFETKRWKEAEEIFSPR